MADKTLVLIKKVGLHDPSVKEREKTTRDREALSSWEASRRAKEEVSNHIAKIAKARGAAAMKTKDEEKKEEGLGSKLKKAVAWMGFDSGGSELKEEEGPVGGYGKRQVNVTMDENNNLMSQAEALKMYGDWRPDDLPPREVEIVEPSNSSGPPGPSIEPLIPGTDQDLQKIDDCLVAKRNTGGQEDEAMLTPEGSLSPAPTVD